MKKLIFIFAILLLANFSNANNILVNNVSVVAASNTIRFTVSWDNSWRSSTLNNWDAAWVFLKYYDPVGLDWKPVYFTNAGNVIPAGFTATLGSTGGSNIGVFLYRSAPGSGTSTITNIELGIPAQQATGIYDIKVFAIEMVYVPQGSFYLGDGVSDVGRYGGNAALTVPGFNQGAPTSGIYDPLTSPAGFLTGLPAAFPNGYGAFYSMKYELSQGGYRDFLNSLTYNQQVSRTAVLPTSATGTSALSISDRNYLEIKTPGIASTTPAVYGCDANANNIYDEATDGEWVACNYLTWPDQAAYLTWAGLRPLTEMEYEKACRGIQVPVAGEYAWGNINIASSVYILSNPSQASEIVSNASTSPTGNANWTTTSPTSPYNGPLRNGVFATATSNRISSGGSFYGIMEMSGNLFERVITSATSQGQSFNGLEGNGVINANGNATGNSTWPGYTSGTSSIDGTTNANGLIIRGGGWSHGLLDLRTSNRAAGFLILDPNINRANCFFYGIRGGRIAP